MYPLYPFHLRGVKRNGRIIEQASSEELVLVLRGGRIVNDIPEAPADLGHVSKTKTAWHRIVLVLDVS